MANGKVGRLPTRTVTAFQLRRCQVLCRAPLLQASQYGRRLINVHAEIGDCFSWRNLQKFSNIFDKKIKKPVAKKCANYCWHCIGLLLNWNYWFLLIKIWKNLLTSLIGIIKPNAGFGWVGSNITAEGVTNKTPPISWVWLTFDREIIWSCSSLSRYASSLMKPMCSGSWSSGSGEVLP